MSYLLSQHTGGWGKGVRDRLFCDCHAWRTHVVISSASEDDEYQRRIARMLRDE